jgi:membrane glycosyltransferase
MNNKRLGRTATALAAVAAVFTFAACSSAADDVADEAKKVEQTLHDDVVKAYDATKNTFESLESEVSEDSRSLYDTAKSDLAALETRIDDAASTVGDEAVTTYRNIEHDLRRIAGNVDDFLHRVGSGLVEAEHAAWNSMKQGYHDVADAVTHVIDRLH